MVSILDPTEWTTRKRNDLLMFDLIQWRARELFTDYLNDRLNLDYDHKKSCRRRDEEYFQRLEEIRRWITICFERLSQTLKQKGISLEKNHLRDRDQSDMFLILSGSIPV